MAVYGRLLTAPTKGAEVKLSSAAPSPTTRGNRAEASSNQFWEAGRRSLRPQKLVKCSRLLVEAKSPAQPSTPIICDDRFVTCNDRTVTCHQAAQLIINKLYKIALNALLASSRGLNICLGPELSRQIFENIKYKTSSRKESKRTPRVTSEVNGSFFRKLGHAQACSHCCDMADEG